ncbi:MAG: hypothetical protein D8M59_01430 [Planctomycetes bacterium]|nr:hypothetical protein [Planctomycetota bacterium]NOG54616.1 hypothetical protein [Planctomycetota bacterium]
MTTKYTSTDMPSASLRSTPSIRLLLPILFVIAITAVGGCAATHFDDPVEAMTSRALTQAEVINAMRQAEAEQPDNELRLKALRNMITETGYTLAVRTEACNELLAYDEQAARVLLRLRLPYMMTWDFIEYLCDEATANNWTDFTSSLIRSLSRPAPMLDFNDRPERKALLTLYPDRDLQEIIFEYIRQPSPNAIEAEWRLKAWELLAKTGQINPLFDLLLGDPDPNAGTDPLLDELRYVADELGIIPITREEILWLRRLAQPEYADWWQQCKDTVAPIDQERRADIRVRHLAVLIQVRASFPEWLDMSHADLCAEMTNRLDGSRDFVFVHNVADKVLSDEGLQTFATWQDKLAWPDLLAVRLADEILSDPRVQQELMAQAEADRGDTSTEHGGVLTMQQPEGAAEPQPTVIPFSPRYRGNDYKFFAPDEMVVAGYTAPFHYHFHAQKANNREYAGPGLGDLQYAEAMGINGIVLTTVGSRSINMDYYQPAPRIFQTEQKMTDKQDSSDNEGLLKYHPAVIELGTYEVKR